MKILVISNLSPQDRFVLARVHETWPLEVVIQPIWGSRRNVSARYAKFIRSPIKTIGHRLKTEFYDRLQGRLSRRVAKELDVSKTTRAFNVPYWPIPREDINSDETAAIIRRFEPDVLITSGSPLLKPKIFEIPRLATINVHWGVVPHYRGEYTLFWPLYFGDYGNIGVTIHQIDEGIDSGPILAVGFPELSPNDTEATLNAKCARMSAHLLKDVLARIGGRPTSGASAPQEHGRLFLRRHRSFRHDIAYWFKRMAGIRTPPRMPSRRKLLIESGETRDDARLADSESVGRNQ